MTDTYSTYVSRLTLTGTDTVALLERLVTCKVESLAVDAETRGALLTPQGKVLADFHLTRTATGAWLDTSPQIAADLEKRLKMFRLRADVEITRADKPIPEIDHAARIASISPAFGFDYETASVFPTDINLDIVDGIDYKKGCFVGQEVVSRMARRGKIRKRTVCLDGAGLEAGQDVQADGKRLGTITSASATNALAIMRIDHLQTAINNGAALMVGDQTLTAQVPDWLNSEMEALADASD
ncbi:MAG: hypothetical protein ABJG15_03195 [Hyphomonadaceae bacterium]